MEITKTPSKHRIHKSPSRDVWCPEIRIIPYQSSISLWHKMHFLPQLGLSKIINRRILKFSNKIKNLKTIRYSAHDTPNVCPQLHKIVQPGRLSWVSVGRQAHPPPHKAPECVGNRRLHKHPKLQNSSCNLLPNRNPSLVLSLPIIGIFWQPFVTHQHPFKASMKDMQAAHFLSEMGNLCLLSLNMAVLLIRLSTGIRRNQEGFSTSWRDMDSHIFTGILCPGGYGVDVRDWKLIFEGRIFVGDGFEFILLI